MIRCVVGNDQGGGAACTLAQLGWLVDACNNNNNNNKRHRQREPQARETRPQAEQKQAENKQGRSWRTNEALAGEPQLNRRQLRPPHNTAKSHQHTAVAP